MNDSRLEIPVVSVGPVLCSYNHLTFFSFLKINLKSKARPVIVSSDVSNKQSLISNSSLLEPTNKGGTFPVAQQ